jgi:hypothetical protein
MAACNGILAAATSWSMAILSLAHARELNSAAAARTPLAARQQIHYAATRSFL